MVYAILGPIVTTIIALIADLIFMVEDVVADAKKVIANALGTAIPLGVASFASFNIDYVTSLSFTQGIPFLNEYTIRGALVLVLSIIIHAKSSVYGKGSGTHEKWLHTLIVASIVGAGPYLWPIVEPFLPI